MGHPTLVCVDHMAFLTDKANQGHIGLFGKANGQSSRRGNRCQKADSEGGNLLHHFIAGPAGYQRGA